MIEPRNPYQCLAVRQSSPNHFLFAASGPYIFSIDIRDGSTLDTWPLKKDDVVQVQSFPEIIITQEMPDNGEPPSKKRKTASQAPKIDIPASILKLLVTKDGHHLVATTGEEKSVHVLSIKEDGKFGHLSQRRMNKRPCAVTLSIKEDFILVGDKFGDVYALPLLEEAPTSIVKLVKPPKSKSVPFKPSATNLTVHTARNLKSLESQKKQAEAAKGAELNGKDDMDFDHELLLGHVSMLTDIISCSLPGKSGLREYIITADRDEHIRISRGHPQAHIIENYCFGHTQFASKLCLEGSDILISGGGDDVLYVWSWAEGRLLASLGLRQPICEYLQGLSPQLSAPETIAVSGIWSSRSAGHGNLILVYCALEGVSAIFKFKLDLDAIESGAIVTTVLQFDGNVLDVVILPKAEDDGNEVELIVSVDSIHQPNTRTLRTASEPSSKRLCNTAGVALFDVDDRGDIVAAGDARKLSDLLYNIEKLRKGGNDDD